MTDHNLRKPPFLPQSLALRQAVRHVLSPRVAGGLLAVSLAGLASPILALELRDLDGSNGFAINGIQESDYLGRSVSGAGDINGDGIDDLIIGARGQGYVVFGARDGFPAALELSALNGSNGFTLQGGDYGSRSVSGAGDINGDGIDDLIIGVRGRSYIVFGTGEGFPAVLELSDLDGSNGFILNGAGDAVSSAGDINGDGIDDVMIGAPWANSNGRQSGQSYVVFGTRGSFPATLELAALDGSNGFALNGINAYDNSGFSVSGAGDVNGDGIDDVIIGAPNADPNGKFQAGQSYVMFGAREDFPAAIALADLNGSNGLVINGIEEGGLYAGEQAGFSVSSAGDVNGDGIDDVIIGAPEAGRSGRRSAGQGYVVFGNRDGFPVVELSGLDGHNGFILRGPYGNPNSPNARTGWSVSGAGDVNGDGIDDLIIGAPDADPINTGNYGSGQSYLVFGTRDGFPAMLRRSDLYGSRRGLVIDGINSNYRSGWSVSRAGDINGDGVDDVIIGAPEAYLNDYSFGQSYIVFGEGPGIPVAIDIKPGSTLNRINPHRQARLPVAILGSDSFDVTQADPATVRFGPDQARDIPWRRQIKDMDGDGHLDLVLRFQVQDTGLACGDTQALLTGMTFAGEAFQGMDSLRTVGCQAVTIDIRPGITPNRINPYRQEHLPIAILSNLTFDATGIDPATVRFGPAKAQQIPGREWITDSDGDGNADLILYFRIQDTGIQCGDTQATLTGETSAGQAIFGSDTFLTVGCN